METGFIERVRDVPPASGNIKQVTIFQDSLQEWFPSRSVWGYFFSEWMKTRWVIVGPSFTPRHLQDHRVRHIPMEIQTFLSAPTCVEIDVCAAAKNFLTRVREPAHHRVQFIDAFENQIRARGQLIDESSRP